jgi:hypothetical protein
MAIKVVHGSIAVPRAWDNADGLRRMIATWQRAAPDLLPTLAGDHEPVRHPFDPDDIDAALPSWASRFWIARRTKPILHASFLGSYGQTNSTGHFSMPASGGGLQFLSQLSSLILALCEEWGPDLAMVHVLCDPEYWETRATGRPDVLTINRVKNTASMSTGFSKQLEHGLPTIWWTNVFGPRYEAVLSTDRLLAAPWESVERRPYGLVARVTADPPDDDSWPAFRSARDRIIDVLGRDAFWPEARRVPDLSLLSG